MIPQLHLAAARFHHALVGAVAGLSAWALVEIVPDAIANARLVLLVVAGGLGFFGVLLALMGPVRLSLSAAAAALLAVPAALLLYWASFRHADVGQFLQGGYAVLAFIYLLAIALPFVIAGLERKAGWRHYGLLFDAAWNVVVRLAAAALFVGVAWAVLLLSDALLRLVGLHIIDRLIEIEAMPYLISGTALGLGVGIVHQMRDYVSPFLVIQLLRVLLPALLVVLAVFILALPFRGLGNLFGQVSAAATLMAVAVAGITLVTTAIHRDDSLSVSGAGMLGAARLMSLMLPVPAALAVWAVWLRSHQYGLTPDRIAAMVAAIVVALYAASYAVAVLRGAAWRAQQRGVNRAMALLTLGVAALWLTPALNAERLSVASQIARAERGAPPEQLALWEMAHEWGRAGQRGLDRLEAQARDAQDTDLLALIDDVRAASAPWAFQRLADDAGLPPLDTILPLRPEGASLPPGALARLEPAHRRMIHDACTRRTPGGHPGCVLIVADFEPETDVRMALGLYMSEASGVRVFAYRVLDGGLYIEGYPIDTVGDAPLAVTPEMIADVFEGRYRIAPSPRNVLELGGFKIFPQR